MMNLSSHRSLEITAGKICPVNCWPLCPQMKFRKVYGDRALLLSYDDFKLALSKTPRDVRIDFSGFCEPFVNSRTMDMIELAKREGHDTTLSTTLTGLRPEDVKRMVPQPDGRRMIDIFCLHLPDSKGIAHIEPTPTYKDTLVEVLETMNIEAYARMSDATFAPHDRAGNSDSTTKPRHVRGPLWCWKLVRPQPVMLPDMTVLLCNMDFTMRHVVGNMREQTYEEIVDGEAFRKIVRERWHMDGTALCRSCSYAWFPPKAALIMTGWSLYRKLFWYARTRMQV